MLFLMFLNHNLLFHLDILQEVLAYIVKKKNYYFQEIHYLEELGEEQMYQQEILKML
jgi:hypothetical protein